MIHQAIFNCNESSHRRPVNQWYTFKTDQRIVSMSVKKVGELFCSVYYKRIMTSTLKFWCHVRF